MTALLIFLLVQRCSERWERAQKKDFKHKTHFPEFRLKRVNCHRRELQNWL